MRAGRILLLILGLLLVLAGLGAGAAGTVAGWAHLILRDDEGFVTSPDVDLVSDGYALTAEHLELDVTPGAWTPGSERLDLRLRVVPDDPEAAVFVGIGPRADVSAYLEGVAHDEVTRLNPPSAEIERVPGQEAPERPGDETFWVESAEGQGEQSLLWEAESGDWSVVVMNADASPGVAVTADAGARTALLGAIAVGLLIGALVLIGGGTALIIAAFPEERREVAALPAAPRSAARRPSPVVLVGTLDPQVSRWQWLVKWLLLIPHAIVLAFLFLAFFVLTVVAGIAILVTGRYPRGIFDLNVGILRWGWRVAFYGYSALATDRYPPFTLAETDYPAQLDIAYPERLSRGLVLVKWWLLALPHLIIVGVLTGGAATWTFQVSAERSWQISLGGGLIGLLVLVAGVALLFTARYPAGLFDLIMGLNRWVARVIAYVALMTDQYPPFRLDMGGSEPPTTGPPSPAPPSTDRAPTPV